MAISKILIRIWRAIVFPPSAPLLSLRVWRSGYLDTDADAGVPSIETGLKVNAPFAHPPSPTLTLGLSYAMPSHASQRHAYAYAHASAFEYVDADA